MLILARKYTEKIILRHDSTGEIIVIEQREIRGTISRIGITAPREWKVLRGEIDDNSTQQRKETK
jgi:carbon storage regulator CsrA